MNTYFVLDTETNGFPKDEARDWRCVIVEIGAVAVVDGEIVGSFNRLVRHSERLLRHDRSAEAFEVTGIDIDQVLRDGIVEQDAANELMHWLETMHHEHGEGLLVCRAFNQAFDFRLLRRSPWNLFDGALHAGDCIMLEAMAVMGPAGALPPAPYWAAKRGQKWKWPNVGEAVEFFSARGYDIAFESAQHRASEDARVEALIALAIEAEKRKVRERNEFLSDEEKMHKRSEDRMYPDDWDEPA